MRIGFIILSLTIGIVFTSHAQINLVPNSSFENKTQCPDLPGQIYYAFPWTDPNSGSSDLFSACATPQYIGVPENIGGSQTARTGTGYAGFMTYSGGSGDFREYIQVPLDSQLELGKNYYCEFYVSLADTATTAASNIGAYFSSIAISASMGQLLNYLPQVSNTSTNPLIDKVGWEKISGNFISNGTEQYLTIGNFLTDSSTDTIHVGGSSIYSAAYYYIDDISLVCLDCEATSINEVNNPFNLNIYPNPAQDFINLTYQSTENKEVILNVYDFTGKLITMQQLSAKENTFVLNTSNLSNGVYLCTITLDNSVSSKRLIIAK